MSTRLWVLKRIESRPVYDCSDGFVIRAVDAAEARLMASKKAGDEGPDAWLSSDRSSCDELLQSGQAEVILIDFHAG